MGKFLWGQDGIIRRKQHNFFLNGGVCLNYSPLKVSTTKKTIVVPFLAEEGLLQNYENFKQP